MQYDKLQLGCLLIVLYVAFIYVRERYAYKIKKKEPVFAWLLVMGILEITLDGITAYTVNHLDSVPAVVNMVLHMCFLCSLDIMMFLMFLYLLDITRGIPKIGKKDIADGSIGDQSCHCYYFYAAAFLSAREYYELFHGNFCIYLFYHGGKYIFLLRLLFYLQAGISLDIIN